MAGVLCDARLGVGGYIPAHCICYYVCVAWARSDEVRLCAFAIASGSDEKSLMMRPAGAEKTAVSRVGGKKAFADGVD